MIVTPEPVTAPYAVLEARRPRRSPLAIVFGRPNHPRDELLVTVDPATQSAQLVLHSADFEGEGTGPVVVRHLSARTCTATGWLTVRGFNRRTERGETVEISLAATWSLGRGGRGLQLDVAGTALAFHAATGTTLELEALRGHEFNHLEPVITLDPDGGRATVSALSAGATAATPGDKSPSPGGGGSRRSIRRPGFRRRRSLEPPVPATTAA